MHRLILTLCFAAVSVLAADQDDTDILRNLDVFEFEVAADPQISPDGSRVVYVRRSMDIMTDRPVSNLWIIDADGDNHRPLLSGSESYSRPRWSPSSARSSPRRAPARSRAFRAPRRPLSGAEPSLIRPGAGDTRAAVFECCLGGPSAGGLSRSDPGPELSPAHRNSAGIPAGLRKARPPGYQAAGGSPPSGGRQSVFRPSCGGSSRSSTRRLIR